MKVPRVGFRKNEAIHLLWLNLPVPEQEVDEDQESGVVVNVLGGLGVAEADRVPLFNEAELNQLAPPNVQTEEEFKQQQQLAK